MLPIRKLISSPARYLFFGNYFYGICAVALSIEASLQQQVPLNNALFYIFIFCVTVLYYTRAYITEKKIGSGNPRTIWYWEHRNFIFQSQILLTGIAFVYPVDLIIRRFEFIWTMPAFLWFAVLLFPVSAALYYGINHPLFSRYRLRNIGWLKPFLIGFVWAGLVTVYPLVTRGIEEQHVYRFTWPFIFLFTKNFMFITVLCIMFDIKDYAADHNRQLKTFVVKAGLRTTIFIILIPLCIVGLAAYLLYAQALNFSGTRILLNVIPFVMLLLVTFSMQRRKSIFYYLVVIDGLMLLKAVCGSVAMLVENQN
jgi:hypothetical protein